MARSLSQKALYLLLATMIKNFLLISVRNILRNKGAAYLNILGLTLGMAACIFLFNYIQSHLFYDRLPQAQSVFRVETTTSTRGEITVRDAFTAPVVGPRLANNHVEIASYARLLPFSEYGSAFFKYQKHDSLALSVFVEKAYYADRSILDVLSLTLLQGNRDSALAAPNTLLLSATLAKRIFPQQMENNSSIVGQEFVSAAAGFFEQTYVIGGVFDDRPEKTHLKFDLLVSLSSPATGMDNPGMQQSEVIYTYILVSPDFDVSSIEKAATSPGSSAEMETYEKGIFLRPIEDIHLSTEISNEPEDGISPTLLVFLAVIAVIIVVLACTNYVNNAIINSIERAKEIGVRKLLGITPTQLTLTFVGEALLTNTLAGLLSIFFFLFGTKLIVMYTNISYPPVGYSNMAVFVLFLILLILVSTLLSSAYPAFHLSSLNPIDSLRGKTSVINSGNLSKGSSIIRSLLIFQLTSSIIFLSAVYIVYLQLDYIERSGGTSREIKMSGVFPGLPGANAEFTNQVDRFILHNRGEGIRGIHISNLYQGKIKTMQAISGLAPVEKQEDGIYVKLFPGLKDTTFNLYVIDHQYWKDSSSVFLAGRNFRNMGDDFNSLVVNESAAKALGFGDPEMAVGQTIDSRGGYHMVVGVVKNQQTDAPPSIYVTGFRHRTYMDFVLFYHPNQSENISTFLQEIRFQIGAYFPNFFFLSRGFENRLALEEGMLKMFFFFAIIAIVIANMGMFGLASYVTQKRTKEIGIRKILGAPTHNIMLLLLYDFLKLILIAYLISNPIVWFSAKAWLDDYPFRIGLDPTLILFPVLFILFISTLVIAEKCWQTAIKSPLDSLDAN
ncbi:MULTISPECIES: ABC transporter permease [unclassified Imperialibacter]|uniref:ABC transporter permease n=1 Tax=unclassified Imperialibacter TaxID=2629706 RepID=UPI0012514EB2|nr:MULTISPECIES: FtsX-like permease family protein [unclassified Imperialibacter]CAD5267698.1 conserved membrane hypothetical protein [Imperialibacter sp. 75]CAD5280137.1 conserved membrane hypothetical protein [Imperialibacter sp. 89]VVT01275.1 conserved membrane hypothetical protein [Imperialibacter sp. EC-SDR9]